VRVYESLDELLADLLKPPEKAKYKLGINRTAKTGATKRRVLQYTQGQTESSWPGQLV
jgi:hypothetical protein